MFPGFLIQIFIVLIVIGLILYLVQMIPMDAAIARIIKVVEALKGWNSITFQSMTRGGIPKWNIFGLILSLPLRFMIIGILGLTSVSGNESSE